MVVLVEKQVGKGKMEARPKSVACGLELFIGWWLLGCQLELLATRKRGGEVSCNGGGSWPRGWSTGVREEQRKKERERRKKENELS